MEIRASANYDINSMKALVEANNTLSKINQNFIIALIAFAAFLLFMALDCIIAGEISKFSIVLTTIVATLVAIVFLIRFLMNHMYKTVYKNNSKYADMHTDYIFNPFGFSYSFTHGSYRGDMVCGYDMIYKVVELDDYFVIFHRKNAAHVIDKSTLTGGTVEDLRAMLYAAFGKNYITHLKKKVS